MKELSEVLGHVETQTFSLDEYIEDLMQHPSVTQFIEGNLVNQEEVLAGANEISAYIRAVEDAKKGIVYSGNTNIEPVLTIDEHRKISFSYQFSEAYENLLKLRDYITCFYMDDQMLTADIADFQKEITSPDLVKVFQMIKQLNSGVMPEKGFFIAGENGVGKTHLLMAIAKIFYRQKVRTNIVFVPELIRDLKQNPYQSASVMKKLQQIPVLMIDDIGSEMQTSFSRDEVLLPILNARMNDGLITFFTSNLDWNSLEHHFAQTQYGENEPIKAKRIMERIKTISNYIVLSGENKRQIKE